MPDGMTPENKPQPQSSIDFMRSLGKPAELPGSKVSEQAARDFFQPISISELPGATEQLKAAQNFPQLESKANIPDIKMELDPKKDKNEEDRKAEDEAESQRYTRRESLSDELISSAETPEELLIGLRQLEKQLDESFIPPNLSERYTPPRQLSVMYERADMLGKTIDEMIDKGFIKKGTYNPETGEAELKDRRYAALAIKSEVKDEYLKDDQGNLVTGKNGRPVIIGQEVHYFFGKGEKNVGKDSDGKEIVSFFSKERQDLEKAYRRGMFELAARDIVNEHFGLRDSTDIRDSLETMVAYLHGGRMPKFKAEHLEALFNMPSLSEIEKNPEDVTFGSQVEEAMFCNLIMLKSGTKQGMLDLLERPGAKDLIKRLADRQGVTIDQWKRENIGELDKWVGDDARFISDKDLKGNDVIPTWLTEEEQKVRGSLTKWSNIVAWSGPTGGFSKENEDNFIGETIGGLVGSSDAAWLASVMMRAIGAYASEGYVALPDGQCWLPLGEGRLMSGDDTGKFWAYMFNMKEGRKGRVSGQKDLIGRIPDMAMNLFDWAQVEVTLPDGTKVRRSIWDAWLGTAEQLKKDLITGKDVEIRDVDRIDETKGPDHIEVFKRDPKTGKEIRLLGAKVKDPKTGKEILVEKVEMEQGNRLGNLKFKTLEREFHNTFTIMQWLMGNGEGPTGVFIEAMNVDKIELADFYLNKLKKMWKYIGIVMNPIVLTKGSLHLYDLGATTKDQITTFDLTEEGSGKFVTHELTTKNVTTIQKRFFRNLMAARVRSFNFMIGILPKMIDVPNFGVAGGDTIPIPAANLVKLFVNEMMKNDPKNEEEVIAHYVDDVARVGGVEVDLKKSYGIRNEAAGWLRRVGVIKGRKNL